RQPLSPGWHDQNNLLVCSATLSQQSDMSRQTGQNHFPVRKAVCSPVISDRCTFCLRADNEMANSLTIQSTGAIVFYHAMLKKREVQSREIPIITRWQILQDIMIGT